MWVAISTTITTTKESDDRKSGDKSINGRKFKRKAHESRMRYDKSWSKAKRNGVSKFAI